MREGEATNNYYNMNETTTKIQPEKKTGSNIYSEKLQMRRIWDWKRSEEIGLCQNLLPHRHRNATNAKTTSVLFYKEEQDNFKAFLRCNFFL
jgi:hypothetical protein